MQKIFGAKSLKKTFALSLKKELHRFPNVIIEKDLLIATQENQPIKQSKDFRLVSTEDLIVESTKKQADIIFDAYQKSRETSFAEFYGGWSVAIIENNKIILACDQSGYHNFYYYEFHDYFIFSSFLKDLVSFPLVQKEPYIPYIINDISQQKKIDHTAFKNIYFIPRGHYLEFDFTTNKKNLVPFWFPQNLPLLRFNKLEEYYECFREIYTTCIHNLIKNKNHTFAATLSGGLDSGSIATIAAKKLYAENQSLHSYTWIPAHNVKGLQTKKILNEKPLVELILQENPNIVANFIDAKEKSIIASIKKHVLLGLPRLNGNILWIQKMLEMAQQQNITHLFVGEGGNRTISQSVKPHFTSYDRDKSSWQKTLKQIFFWYHPQVLQIRHSMHRENLIPFLHKKKHNVWANFFSIKKWNAESFYKEQLLTYIFSSGRYWNNLAEFYGIKIIDPTMDQKIIEFCLRIPQKVYGDRDLIRKSCHGIMPQRFLENHRRGLQANDLIVRFLKEEKEIQQLVNKFIKNDIIKNNLDVSLIKKIITSLSEKSHIQETRTTLMRTLTIGFFCKAFFSE